MVPAVVKDGVEIYISPKINPGEALVGFELDEPLAPGDYEAMAVASIYDETGERLFANRIPVTLHVQAQGA